VRSPGLDQSGIAEMLGVFVELSAQEANTVERPDPSRAPVLGARAVHYNELPGPTSSYSVSSHSPSIDSCAVRVCSSGHRCSGTYTPRVATTSGEPDVSNSDSARQVSSGNAGVGT
jgi:hypothetical protein